MKTRASSHMVREILEGGGGAIGLAARAGLTPLSWLYSNLQKIRRHAYKNNWLESWAAPVPVISIGNLAVGGMGKTPFVIWLAKKLAERKIPVGVVARGYGSPACAKDTPDIHANDEEILVRQALPGILYESNPRRRLAMEKLVSQGAQAIILDDAFQHLAVKRSLDIVLLDATHPLATGKTLPAGILREPASALRKADICALTRVDAASPAELAQARETIRRHAPQAKIVEAAHKPARLASATGETYLLEKIKGVRIAALCSIARPSCFEATLKKLGAEISASFAFPDHHQYTAEELQAVLKKAKQAGAEMLVTTGKDMVKLAALLASQSMPVLSLEIEMAITAGEADLTSALNSLYPPQ